MLAAACLAAVAAPAWATDPLVITQFRAGAAAGGDFVELLNISAAPVSLPAGGWRLYAADATAAATCDLVSPAKAPALSLAPGQHWLIGQSALPKTDASFSSLSASPCPALYSAGGIALAAGTLSDRVGYGAILGAPVEGAPAPAPPTNGEAERRKDSGYRETESNAQDFQITQAIPQGSTVTDPSVSTGAASSITPVSATLSGSANPHAQTVSDCHFDLGTSTAYGSRVSCSTSPSGSTQTVDLTGSATALRPATTYHYRLTVTVAGGTFAGPDRQFTTPPSPYAKTGAATAVSGSTATLTGTVNLEGQPLRSCAFRYGATTAYGLTAACSQTPNGTGNVTVSASITGLAAAHAYHFELVVTTSAGTALGGDRTFQTTKQAPAVTTGPATAISATAATLNGTVNAHGLQLTVCEFVYGRTTAYGHTATCASMPSATVAMPVSAAVAGLSPGTKYHFALLAQSAGGRTIGHDHTFYTGAAPPPPPAGYTLPARAIGQRSATLRGAINPGGAAVSDCHFDFGRIPARGAAFAYTGHIACVPSPSGTRLVAVSATVTGLKPATPYRFRLVVTTTGGTLNAPPRGFRTRPVGVLVYRARIDRRHRRASFRFRAVGGPASGFQCALVRLRAGHRAPRPRYRACRSPQTYRHLARGRYIFYVRPRGSAAHARYRFRI
jgi:hypothetical protein